MMATTFEVPEPVAKEFDPLAFAGDDGIVFIRDAVTFAARGEAKRVALDAGLAGPDASTVVTEALTLIDRLGATGPVGVGPVAFGALPFLPSEPSWMTVPLVTIARTTDGRAWCTWVGDIEHRELPGMVAPRREGWSPSDFALHACTPHARWCSLLASAVDRIRAGELDKVVLARAVDVVADEPIVIPDVLARMRALFPSCTVFHIDGFVGASPELLVGRLGDRVAAHPLAGTVARSGDPDSDARLAAGLLASSKDRWEHALTVDAVADILTPLCLSLSVPDAPTIVALRNVSHLGSFVEGRLREPLPTALDLVVALHPTPAVGGVPTAKALEVMAAIEPLGRGRYAGPVGWMDAAGNGEWVVGLRSAQIEGNRARMMAGGGIVSDSDPREELAETQVKLQAMLAAIVRP